MLLLILAHVYRLPFEAFSYMLLALAFVLIHLALHYC